jgi:hypothetical protein
VSETSNDPVAGVRSLTLFPLNQISYTFMGFKNSDNLLVVRILRLNFAFCLN